MKPTDYAVDLNNPHEFTFENVRRLIASKDDSASRQLRVTFDNKAFLSDLVGNTDTHLTKLQYETWDRDNGCCGIKASMNDDWIMQIYKTLKRDRHAQTADYIDFLWTPGDVEPD